MTTKSRNRLWIAGALLLGVVSGSCGEATGPPVPVPTDVTVTGVSGPIASLGQQVTLTAVVRDQNGNEMSGLDVTWTSSSPAILVHEGAGRFRSVANGQVTVTAAVGGDTGVEGEVQVTVAQAAASLGLVRVADTLWAVGQTDQWTARAFDALGTALATAPAFTWTSANPGIATVSNTGLVAAVADGATTIQASGSGLNTSLPIAVSATVPYELCVNLTLGSGPGTEVCTTLAITVHQ